MLILLTAIALFAAQLSAANFSGKWSIPTGPRRPPIELTLNQVGTKVTGYIAASTGVSTGSPANWEVLGGKVDGDVISFYLWTGMDKPVKVHYKGTLSGDEMKLTAGPAQVTAKRID